MKVYCPFCDRQISTSDIKHNHVSGHLECPECGFENNETNCLVRVLEQALVELAAQYRFTADEIIKALRIDRSNIGNGSIREIFEYALQNDQFDSITEQLGLYNQ